MDDLTKRLAAEYPLAALRKEAETFSRFQDREKHQMIAKRYDGLVRDQTRAYEQGYAKRLRMASEHICQRHGQSWTQIEKRKDDHGLALQKRVTRQAHREVQNDHQRRIAVLRNREAGELKELVETVRQRERQSPKASPIPDAPKLLTDQRADPRRLSIRRER